MKTILTIQAFLDNLNKSLVSIIRIIVLSKHGRYIKKLNRVKDIVILGNGPSLKNMIEKNAAFLKDKDLFSVNHFPTTEYFTKLKPKYYITIAPDLWNDNVVEPYRTASDKLFEAIAEKTNWELSFYMPFIAKKHKRWREKIEKNNFIKIKYINITPVEGWRFFRHFFFKKNIGMPRPHNIMIPSIFTSVNLGYKKIYLWGTDHSWLPEISVNEENIALINQKHFYDFENSTAETLPMDKEGKTPRKLHEILMKFMLAFKGYFIINEYAHACNVKILNSTKGSYIDAFERDTLT